MSQEISTRAITPADIQAAKRLKAVWNQRAKARGLTQYSMAERMGRTQGLVSNYLNGVIALNYRALMQFCDALGIDDPSTIRDDLPEQRLSNRIAEPPPPPYGDWLELAAFPQPSNPDLSRKFARIPSEHRLKFSAEGLRELGLELDHLRVFIAGGDSMLPRIKDGDALIYDASDAEPIDGLLYVVETLGTESVKRCDVLDGDIFFKVDNPSADTHWKKPRRASDPANPIRVLGRVRWIGGWES